MILGLRALELSFVAVLVAMTLGAGLVAMTVVARVVEPRGVKALLERIIGREIRLRPGRTS